MTYIKTTFALSLLLAVLFIITWKKKKEDFTDPYFVSAIFHFACALIYGILLFSL